MNSGHSLWLVVLSIIVGVITSYVARHLASRAAMSKKRLLVRDWIIGGAIAVGIGLWATHFIAMVALVLPVPISYDIPSTVSALFLAVIAAGVALHTVSQGNLSTRRLTGGAVMMGICIAAMQYKGMAAMHMAPPIIYDPLKFTLFLVIVVVGAAMSLSSAFHLRLLPIGSAKWKKAGSALVMGAAMAGTNFAGMAAITFPASSFSMVTQQSMNGDWLAAIFGAVSILLLLTTLSISVIEAMFAERLAMTNDLQQMNAGLKNYTTQLSMANTQLLLDAKERAKAEEAVRESEERYRQIVEISPDAIFVRSEDRIVFANSACLRLFGANKIEELADKTSLDLLHPDHQRSVAERLRKMKEKNRPTPLGETRIVRLDGEVIDVEMYAAPFVYKGKQGYQEVIRDITVRKISEQKLVQLAQFDHLTGLPNRALFLDRLSRAMARTARSGQLAALMYLDLDRFKEINDTLGHAIGDLVLQAAAVRMREAVRDADTVARLGGDEFVIVLENLGEVEEAALIANKINASFSVPITIQGKDVFFAVSIGIAIYPRDAREIDALIRAADVAMYHAKESGSNTSTLYSVDLDVESHGYLEMQGLLRRALDRQEFAVHYQPVASVKTGNVTGLEALIRWNSKELGAVSPSQFISLAEESGLIVPIGEWVLQTACEQLATLRDQGFPSLMMAVNLSPRQLREKNLVSTIVRVLAKSGVAPGCLNLEITEGAIMQNPLEAVAILTQLHKIGVKLSIDDFGTGYSSLTYLKRFPINNLKIDQSFVRDVTTNSGDAAIVTAVIAMAKSLNLGVIAEGVETKQQLAFLSALDCDEYQGYFFGSPAPPTEIATLLSTGALRLFSESIVSLQRQT